MIDIIMAIVIGLFCCGYTAWYFITAVKSENTLEELYE